MKTLRIWEIYPNGINGLVPKFQSLTVTLSMPTGEDGMFDILVQKNTKISRPNSGTTEQKAIDFITIFLLFLSYN